MTFAFFDRRQMGLSAVHQGVALAARSWIIYFLRNRKPSNLGQALATVPRMQEAVGRIDQLCTVNRWLLLSAAKDVAAGAKAANSVARRLVVAAHRDGGQSQFIERSLPPPSGVRLSNLLETVQKRIGERWTVERMAAEAHVSVRSIHRHICEATGLAPGEWLQRQRIAFARDLLEETTLSVDDIAARSGFGTGTNFRHHFRAATGLPPATYRTRFHVDDPRTVAV